MNKQDLNQLKNQILSDEECPRDVEKALDDFCIAINKLVPHI
jgi:hypothetical protein